MKKVTVRSDGREARITSDFDTKWVSTLKGLGATWDAARREWVLRLNAILTSEKVRTNLRLTAERRFGTTVEFVWVEVPSSDVPRERGE
jgi:hypothetical protein